MSIVFVRSAYQCIQFVVVKFQLCLVCSLPVIAGATLSEGIKKFESRRYQEAAEHFLPLSQGGGAISSVYLEYMVHKKLIALEDLIFKDLPLKDAPETCLEKKAYPFFELIPELLKKKATDFLRASLAYMRVEELYSSDQPPKVPNQQGNSPTTANSTNFMQSPACRGGISRKGKGIRRGAGMHVNLNHPKLTAKSNKNKDRILKRSVPDLNTLDGLAQKGNLRAVLLLNKLNQTYELSKKRGCVVDFKAYHMDGSRQVMNVDHYKEAAEDKFIFLDSEFHKKYDFFTESVLKVTSQNCKARQEYFLAVEKFEENLTEISETTLRNFGSTLPEVVAYYLYVNPDDYFDRESRVRLLCSIALWAEKTVIARKCLLKSYEFGNNEAAMALALAYNEKSMSFEDQKKAFEYYQQASKGGLAQAYFGLAFHYLYGYGVEQNFKEAVKNFELSVAKGETKGLYYLGELYSFGNGVQKDEKKAALCFLQALDNGDKRAHKYLGLYYLHGIVFEKSHYSAYVHLLEAVKQEKDITAHLNLALLYLYGSGVPRNFKEAIKLLEEIESMEPRAKTTLALLYFFGNGVSQDVSKGLRYFQESAEKNECIALHNLACIYIDQKQEHVKTDCYKAKELAERAVQQGHVPSLALLDSIIEHIALEQQNKSVVLEKQLIQSTCTKGYRVYKIGLEKSKENDQADLDKSLDEEKPRDLMLEGKNNSVHGELDSLELAKKKEELEACGESDLFSVESELKIELASISEQNEKQWKLDRRAKEKKKKFCSDNEKKLEISHKIFIPEWMAKKQFCTLQNLSLYRPTFNFSEETRQFILSIFGEHPDHKRFVSYKIGALDRLWSDLGCTVTRPKGSHVVVQYGTQNDIYHRFKYHIPNHGTGMKNLHPKMKRRVKEFLILIGYNPKNL